MDLALIALSARPLAASAARAGFAALSLDLSADLDTCAQVVRCVKVHKKNGFAFDPDDLIQALTSLAPEGLPVVLGGGLEHDPALMMRIARRNPILGNMPETIRILKDPLALSGLCTHFGIPFPPVALDAPAPGAFAGHKVVEKLVGGAGGTHIRRRAADDLSPPAPDHFLQAEVEGNSYSLLVLSNGTSGLVVGASRQWRADDDAHPFRYGGAVGPVALPEAFADAMREAALRLSIACGLVGLISLDFMVTDDSWYLVEVNPQLSAMLDIFDVDPLPPLLGLHIAACGGRLPDGLPSPSEIHAAGILYAPFDVVIPPAIWPDHVADRPAAGATILKGAPICTVKTASHSVEAAMETLDHHTVALKRHLGLVPAANVPS